jgi:hypothetical protein
MKRRVSCQTCGKGVIGEEYAGRVLARLGRVMYFLLASFLLWKLAFVRGQTEQEKVVPGFFSKRGRRELALGDGAYRYGSVGFWTFVHPDTVYT